MDLIRVETWYDGTSHIEYYDRQELHNLQLSRNVLESLVVDGCYVETTTDHGELTVTATVELMDGFLADESRLGLSIPALTM